MHKNLNLRCSPHTKQAWSRETHEDVYLPFESFSLRGATDPEDGTMESCTARLATSSNERDEDILSALSASERRKPELSIRKLLTIVVNL